MTDGSLLVTHLREPARLADADAATWGALIRIARAESTIGQLGALTHEIGIWNRLPGRVRAILGDSALYITHNHRETRWEIRQAQRALRTLGQPIVLLKGAAYVAAGLPAATGRSVGDLDLLLPRAAMVEAEALLLRSGWAPLKTDEYDDAYYRKWMHELPPLVHVERGTLIDVHHTILPLTARLTPDAEALVADARPLGDGLYILEPADMVLHSAAHLFYDGDLDGGLRNLWDIHRLLGSFGQDQTFWTRLGERARLHQLGMPLARALRFSRDFFGTHVDPALAGRADALDALMRRRLLGCDRWGRRRDPIARQLLYVRSHWLRMPPALLARHLFIKWRMRRRANAAPE